MRTAVAVLLVLSLLVLPGCQMNERLSGTVMGAMGGAGLGAIAGGWGGAAIGLVAGGVSGYIVGDYLADRRECGRCGVFGKPACEPQCAPAPCSYPAPTAQRACPAPVAPGTCTTPAVGGAKAYAPADPAAQAAYDRGRAALNATNARAWFEESIRLDPNRPEPYNALGLNYLYAGQTAEAERLFRKSLEQDPEYYAAKHNLARLTGRLTAAR